MPPFDPPAQDEAGLRAAAKLLGSTSGRLGTDLTTTMSAVQHAVGDWRGARKDEFTRAGAGTQVQLRIAATGCADVAAALTRYATAVETARTDIAGYQAHSDAAFAAVDQKVKGKQLVLGSVEWELAQLAASKTSGQYAVQAADARTALHKVELSVADAIRTVTDKVVPLSSSVPLSMLGRQVDAELGLTGLHGPPTTAAQAWTAIVGAEQAVPAGAVGVDGSVDWTAAFALPPVPAPDTSPGAVNAWWNSLSPAEQDAVLNAVPGKVGNLDGIPVIDRDFANRANLPQLQKGLHDQIAALKGREPTKYETAYQGYREYQAVTPAWQEWNAALSKLQDQLSGLDKVAAALAKRGPAPLFLLGLQPQLGRGRAIIATGNPDTATDVATYVPGMGTKLTGIGGGVDRANAMYTSALRSGASVPSVIAWYGYGAPQSLGPAASEDDAARGAPLLDNFQNGLRFTHLGAPSLNTVIAHSYGTTLTGYAASHGHTLNADNVVFVASPGTSVDHADDLHLTNVASSATPDHIYASTGQYDPISLAAGINGADPTGLSYGAHDFTSNSKAGHWWLLGWNPSQHSAYWNSDNVALRNMGLVIAGHGDQTK